MTRHRALALVLILVSCLLLVSCGGDTAHKTTSIKLLAPPSLKGTGLEAPAPGCPLRPGEKSHQAGDCLPRPAANAKARAPRTTAASIVGPDFSNNDPISCAAMRVVAAHNRFVYLKSVEGTGFYDSTAQGMAACAHAVHLLVGGYDFMHVCGPTPESEAGFFVSSLKRQGLLGAGTLPPSADVEYGSGACGGAQWVQRWVATVYAQDGHRCPIAYTGAWWWQPHIGAYWPVCNGHEIESWISGYGVSYPYMPSGLHHLDFWQFSDHGCNGYSCVDLSVYRNGEARFQALAGQVVPPHLYCFGAHAQLRNPACVAVIKQVAGWRQAAVRSHGAFLARGCDVLYQRDHWFQGQITAHPRSPLTARRKAALAATRQAERKRSCAVFAGRVSYYEGRIQRALATY